MDFQEIKETLKDANEYLSRLQNLNTELEFAIQQIIITTKETENNIETVFSSLQSAINSVLCARRDKLIEKTKKIQEQGLLPLKECQKVVSNKVQYTTDLITFGLDILEAKNNSKNFVLKEFTKKSSLLGSLPEVPSLKEVPYVSFQYDVIAESELVKICNIFGSVIHIAPVQISTLTEKPGAILVEWTMSETDEHILDVQEYHLEVAFGDLNIDKHLIDNFRTLYIGTDNQYLSKGLILNQSYTFRVRCKFEGEAEWSPWSLSQVGKTTLKPFTWSSNENFLITNENKIATPLKNESLLFSHKTDFNVGYSVEFTFLECDDNNLTNTYVGLFMSDNVDDSKVINSESVVVETNGNIYGSGLKKFTQFSPVNKGTKICFSCDFKSEHKLRLNIDCLGKRVTYDWCIGSNPVYLGARFNSSKWKIMID